MSNDHFAALAPEKQELVAYTLGTIQRAAMKIAALPPAARSEAFDIAHRAYAGAMHRSGEDNIAAGRWVELVMTAVRSLVAEIDHSGAARGGRV